MLSNLMSEHEYRAMRKEIERDNQLRLEEVLTANQKRLDALDMVWQMCQERINSESNNHSQQESSESSSGNLIKAVRTVLNHVSGDFTINTVIAMISKGGLNVKQPLNPTSVSGVLRRLTVDGEIELIE